MFDVKLTDAWEGVKYPKPDVYPDLENEEEDRDTGVVVFDFYRYDLSNYVNENGRLGYETALGITEDHIRHCCRKYITNLYGSNDITLGEPKMVANDFTSRLSVRYEVGLGD